MTPRIPPKNGAYFNPGQIIRLEFPAQGYVNPLNTTLEMDVVLYGPNLASANSAAFVVRFQNNIQSIFNRVRLLYGATPQEDILQYNVLVRCLTEWTATNQMGSIDNTSIADGVGGYTFGAASMNGGGVAYAAVNARQSYVQGLSNVSLVSGGSSNTDSGFVPNAMTASLTTALPSGAPVPGTYQTATVRRYQISFALGVFTQDKLIPTKYMASQLAIEITLEQANACIYQPIGYSSSTPPTYGVGNINLIPEIIEFDDSYDVAFLQGLETGGVPIKFSTWHYFQFGTQNSSSLQLQITERSRSVKGIFVVQRRQPQAFTSDSHATFFDSNTATGISTGSTMQQYQFRIGGRYFPAAPVQLSSNVGASTSNGGAEAYVELEKFLNIVGDYRLKPNTSTLNWATNCSSGGTSLPEFDYTYATYGYDAYGMAKVVAIESSAATLSGNRPSCCFASSINFETSNGIEISGLNAEEQSDISFNAIWAYGQAAGFSIECFTYVDVMWVLRPNNYLDLIQ